VLSTVWLFKDALFGALVIAVACSVLGVYVVLRRIVFVGAAMAQLSSAGIALALFLAGHGVYAIAAAAGILLIAKAATGEAHDIFLQGNILGITRTDIWKLLAIAIPVLVVHVAFYKEFLFVSFDREMARTLGYRVRAWNLLLYFTLGLVIAFAMQFAGVILVFNFLVLPAVTGLLLARSMAAIFSIAIGAGVLAAVLGFVLSVPFDLPSGPAIIAASGVLVALAALFRRALNR
jgi:zinc transport system permease protein